MMISLRSETSILGRWWFTVDRWSLAAMWALIAIGAILALASTPPIAQRLGLDPFHFVRRQFAILPVAALILVMVSAMSPVWIRRLAVFGFVGSVALLCATFWVGVEIKGARRWINLGGFSLQPSEFVKPTLVVLTAWMFTRARRIETFPGDLLAALSLAVVVILLLLQPDLGMVVVVSAVWFAQYVLSGLRKSSVILFGAIAAGGSYLAYLAFPHVASRINRFLDRGSGDTFQIDRAQEAFQNGGLFGRGPGEGVVKQVLPDAHSDFVFAVAGEEFGVLACLIIVALFAFIVVRGLTRLLQENDLFILIAVGGLLMQFGLQAIINMGSTLQLLPTKGMTLPFISFGGSSLLAISLGMGMMLALSRRRFGGGEVA
jgi:cell division protein FtsW